MKAHYLRYALISMAMAFAVSACSYKNPAGPSTLPGVAAASFELSGEVTGGGGGLAGVEVSLSRGEGDERRATTDADGKFHIAGLEAGTWTATLKCKGYADRVVEVVVNGNLTISFDLIPAF